LTFETSKNNREQFIDLGPLYRILQIFSCHKIHCRGWWSYWNL